MRLCRLVLALLAALLAVPAAAQETVLDAIIARGTLRVGTTGDYRPFTFRDPASGAWSGLDIDLAQSLGKALGVKVEFVPTSWPTLMGDFAAGKFDIAVGGVTITLERQKKAFFSMPILRDGKTPIALCANVARFQTLEQIDRPEVRVVVNPGGTNERFDRAHLTQAEIRVHPDNATIFQEIIARRVDLMITDASEARTQQKLHPELCAIHPEQPFDFLEKAYLLPRDVALKAFVDQWLHLETETGDLRAIMARYMG
jgi:cyclohexadienyl dehydratase